MTWRPRFSLRTLSVFLLLVTAAMGLWWHWEPWYCERVLEGSPSEGFRATLSLDGARCLTWADRWACEWATANGEKKAVIELEKGGIFRGAFISGKPVVVGYDSDTKVPHVYDVRSGQVAAALERQHYGDWIHFSADGTRVLMMSGDTVRVFDATSGARLARLKDPEFEHAAYDLWEARFSFDGTRIVTVGKDGAARVWEADTGRMIMETPDWRVHCVLPAMLSNDGSLLAAALYTQGKVGIWDTVSGARIGNITTGSKPAQVRGFSPDAERLTIVSGSKTCQIWSVPDGKHMCSFEGHEALVITASLSGDGRRLLTASWDGTGRIWGVSDGKCLAVLKGHQSKLSGATFFPSSERALTWSRDGSARIWRKCRPERWWGVFWLWEFWLTVVFAGVFVWSVVRDRRPLKLKEQPTQ